MLAFLKGRARRNDRNASKKSNVQSTRHCNIEPLESRLLFTVLTFDPASGSFTSASALPQAYGDRVTAATQGGFKYGTAGGFTPNVVAQYGTTGTNPATILCWTTSYGNLTGVIYSSPSGSKFQLVLTADAGFNVSLSSFDMAGYPATNYTINNVKVADGTGKVLFNQNNVLIKGAGPSHTHFTMPITVVAQKLVITFDSSNQGGYNVGMDNVQFSQVKLNTPGPGTVSGTVFNDVNGNGKKDTGDAGLAGWRVYVDANNNGMYDSGETFVLTDSSGNFKLTLPGGTYILSVQLKRGYYQTSPHTLVYNVTINKNDLAGDIFGVKTISPA